MQHRHRHTTLHTTVPIANPFYTIDRHHRILYISIYLSIHLYIYQVFACIYFNSILLYTTLNYTSQLASRIQQLAVPFTIFLLYRPILYTSMSILTIDTYIHICIYIYIYIPVVDFPFPELHVLTYIRLPRTQYTILFGLCLGVSAWLWRSILLWHIL